MIYMLTHCFVYTNDIFLEKRFWQISPCTCHELSLFQNYSDLKMNQSHQISPSNVSALSSNPAGIFSDEQVDPKSCANLKLKRPWRRSRAWGLSSDTSTFCCIWLKSMWHGIHETLCLPTFTLKFKLNVRKTTIHGFYGYWFISKVYLIDNQRQKLTYIIDIHPAVASKAPNLGQVQIWVSLDVGIRNQMSKNVVGLGWYQWCPIVTIVSKTMEIYPKFGSHHDFHEICRSIWRQVCEARWGPIAPCPEEVIGGWCRGGELPCFAVFFQHDTKEVDGFDVTLLMFKLFDCNLDT